MILYDDKMKVLFHLKGGQQGELLLNLIFPEYPDGHGEEKRNGDKIPENERETDKSVSLSSGCAYTPVMVGVTRFERSGAKRSDGIAIADRGWRDMEISRHDRVTISNSLVKQMNSRRAKMGDKK